MRKYHRRLRALIDCDDVLAGFTPRVIELVAERTGVRHNIEDITKWDLFDAIGGDPALRREVYDIIKSEGGCGSLELLEGAKEGLERLRDVADIYIVTAPFIGSKTWVHERYEWLKHHLGIDHWHVVQTHAKEVCSGDIFVDDKLANVVKWGEHNYGRPVLWHRHANKLEVPPPWVSRVHSWEELHKLAYGMAQR